MNKHRKAEETQRVLASIVQNSTDAIYSATPDGIIVSWNRGAEEIFGYSAEEIMGQSISVICPPELRYVQVENLEK
ncbi:MAG: PAS domain S-box protein, partial [Actinomycetota bacterium]|nr:PAS domain S-box protein [Actinomycetota bacterium]